MNALNKQLNQIDELLMADYKGCDTPPSAEIVEEAKGFLRRAFIKWGDLPEATVKADFRGGLRIEYQNNDKHLRLLLEKHRIFLSWHVGERINTRDLTCQRDLFAKQIRWLTG